MKARLTLCLAALAVPAALLAADVFTQYKIDKDQARESLFYAARGGLTVVPPGADRLKAVPPSERAAVVQALGAFAKAYFNSPDFQKRYAQAYQADAPHQPTPPTAADSLMKAMSPQLQQQLKMMQDQMGNMPPDVQAQMKEAMAKMQEAQSGKSPEQLRTKQRYQEELAAYNKALADPRRLPQDPKRLLRRRLTDFLALTQGMDFNAKLTRGDRGQFVDQKLEAKPEDWKMWFRAGREATTAAREYAAAWLKELK
ncbi:MAG TPA: hypothetical protein VMS93_08330 [Candidatus Saccharimonadales bacterium]|nr:hypothetical protein [Candidatus Saccharimonadales bacterium]